MTDAKGDAPGITYEGVDASEHDADWRRALFMPGESVRFDPNPRIHGIDPHETMDALGTDPLVVSKAIVRGENTPDGIGGERKSAYLEYEFEGKHGRWNSKQFMEAEGREHVYGVMLVRNDRAWLVPIHEEGESGRVHADGPARELVGFTGRDLDQLHPEGISGQKAELASEGPIMGEFYVQPRDGHLAPGPVNLLNAPWSASAAPDELAIANNQIDKAIARETLLREDPLQFHIQDMEDASKAFRMQRPVREVDLRQAEIESGLEMTSLLKGRNAGDANVRMAAAMLATDERPIAGHGELSSRRLADSRAPGTDGQDAGRDRLSIRSPAKGPASNGGMPPYGGTLMRRGGAER